MALTQLSLMTSLGWTQAKTNGLYGNTTQGPDSNSFNYNGISLTTFNQIYIATISLAASATQTIDLTSVTNLIAETITFNKVLSVFVLPSGSEVTVQPGGTNALVWFFGGSSQSVIVPDGGMFAFSGAPSGTGQVVDSSHKNLKFTNSGATPLTLDLVIVGGT